MNLITIRIKNRTTERLTLRLRGRLLLVGADCSESLTVSPAERATLLADKRLIVQTLRQV